MEDKIRKCITQHVPHVKTKASKPPKVRWMDSFAMDKVKEKHHAYICYINTLAEKDLLKYRRSRNKAQKAVRHTKHTYGKNLALEAKTNNKAIWKYVSSKTKVKVGISDLLKPDGTLATTDKDKAECLNSQYCRVFTSEDTNAIPDIPPKTTITEPLTGIKVDMDSIRKKLNSLKADKAPGDDGIHPRVLKEASDVLAAPISILFQKSLDEGVVPSQWKDAVVTPIYKKGARKQPANYRPVSLTSVLCKLLERVIVENITDHLSKNDLQAAEQHGFTKGKSTSTNLLEALNVWTEALQHNIPVDVVFLDYAKAFDTVPHKRLIRQVQSFGIDGTILKWIEDFLEGRRQRVKVKGEVSEWAPVSSGVPQGSVLGPALFSLFVNDCPRMVNSIMSLFADDTKLYAALSRGVDDTDSIQDDLNILQDWAKSMCMKFHPDKCLTMHLGTSNPTADYTMITDTGDSHTLASVTEEKDLGVIVDNKLSFCAHTTAAIQKANRILGLLRRTFSCMDKTIFIHLYKSLVRPHLEYASPVWSPSTLNLQRQLEQVQRRATRMVPELRKRTYESRLQALNLPSLAYRRRRADIIQAFKIIKGMDQVNQDCRCSECPGKEMLTLNTASTTRGHAYKLKVQHSQGVRARFFSTRVITVWNALPEEVVSSNTVNELKTALARDPHEKTLMFTYV